MRFCSRCGLSLDLVTDLISNSADQFKREKRELTGVGLMMATVLMLLNFLFVFGAVTLPHLANPVFLWIWLSFVISSFVVGGFGFANLVRGDFFKRLRMREARLRLMKAEQDRQIAADATRANIGAAGVPVEPVSVTETTTRELEPAGRANRRA